MKTASLLLLATLCAAPLAHPQATQYPNVPPLLLGAAWYPEQWDEATWEKDLALMEADHIHLARITEFAWSTMEPSEGRFEFAWLDRAIEMAAKHHVVIVLGTPTAAPPAWLTTKYPETLRVDNEGKRDEHGNRQQFSFASAKYRFFAKRITEKMADRYGRNANVVGWQLDNELSATSFDPEAKAQFHAWLKQKYGTIDKLNTLWTTSYWSQTYDTFDEIPVHDRGENPALLLDWRHFVSDTWKSYCQDQVTIIRVHADPRQFITTNTMGWFDGFDAYTVHSILDIAAWDDYVPTTVFDPASNGAEHDLTRGYKQKNFWVMETEPAFVNWRRNNNAINKGQMREMAWQAIGHGADAVEYWQWRAALNGQEQYHGTLLGVDGTPVPAYDEAKQIGEEFEKAGAALAGTTPQSSVAIIESFDSRWAIDAQRFNQAFDPIEELVDFYRPLREASQGIDILPPSADLGKYKLVVAPALNLLTEKDAKHLEEYVKQGGHLILGPRTGMKNEYDGTWTQRQPGPLADLLGGRVEEFYALDGDIPVSGVIGSGQAKVWAELLSTKSADTKTLLTYGPANGWLDGKPAMISRSVGSGVITYVGFWPGEKLLDSMAAAWVQEAGVSPFLTGIPHGVEVCERAGKGKTVFILINHSTSPQQVSLPAGVTALIGTAGGGTITLEKYGIAVLQK
jgi:beta-galactosidase